MEAQEDPLYASFPQIGEAGILRLVAAFYRQVPNDDLLGPMYPPDDLPAAEQRLRDFLVFRSGGSQRYIQERGHPRLRIRHAPFPLTPAARDRWLQLMARALDEVQFPEPAASNYRQFFEHTATFLINRS